MSVLEKREAEIPLNGGMNTSAGAEYQAVETMRDVLDLRINADGEYEKRPGVAATVLAAAPSGTPYGTQIEISGVHTRGAEVFGVTNAFGVVRLDGSSLRYARRSVLHSATPDSALRHCPVPCRVTRRFIERAQLSKDSLLISQTVSAIHTASSTLVVAWTSYSSGLTATLSIKAFDLTTGVVRLDEQTVDLGTTAELNCIRAIELTETNKTGVLVTVGVYSASPVTIKAYRWDSATNEVVFDSNLTTNAANVEHTLASSASDRFYFGFEDNTSGFLTVQDRSIGAVTTTHTATHGALGGCAIVKGPTRTLIASIDGTTLVYNSTLYAEVFGTPASVITLRTLVGTAGNDWFSGVHVALESRTDATNAAVVYGAGEDQTVTITLGQAEEPRFTSFHFVDFTATAPVDQRNGYIPNASCVGAVQVDGRAHGVFAINPDRLYTTLTSLVVVRSSCAVYASPERHDVIARVGHDRFGFSGPDVHSHLDAVKAVGDSMYITMPADSQVSLSGSPPQSMFIAEVDFTRRPMPYLDLGDGTTLLGGGALHQYDGSFPCEAQPIDKPTVHLENTGAGAGSLTGVFGVHAVYSFVDAAGKLHRSAPSVLKTITLAAERFDVYVSALPFTAYDGNTAPLYAVELYVSEAGGTTYYRAVLGSTWLPHTSLTAKNLFYKFVTVPAGSASYPQIYTDGSSGAERPATPPPAFSSLWRVGDIVLGLDAEDPTRVWATKPLVSGFAPEWSNLNTVTIGDQGVGGADVGGQTVVFGKRGMWLIGGSGPNATGGGGFDVARRLPHEVEALDPLSICKAPMGVLFRGRKGVYLMDAGMGLQAVSEPIDGELLTFGEPSGYCRIEFDEMTDEAHLLDFDGSHWVWHASENKWMKWTQDTEFDEWKAACTLDGKLYYVLASTDNSDDSIARLSDTDTAQYNRTSEGWTLETPWIRFDGVTGRMRVRELVVQVRLGAPDAARADITVTYENREGTTETFAWTGAQLSTLGSAGQTVNLRCPIVSQRTKQFKATIVESVPPAAYDGSSPIAMRVLYSVMPGGDRKRSTGQLKAPT